MIRILHSVSYMSRGGIETMLMNYYRHIDRNKVQFDFLCNASNIGAYDDEILELGGRIFRSPGFNPLKYFEYRRYMHDLFISHPEYRIIEAHNGPLGRNALKAAKDEGVPIRIYHAHGADLPFNMKWPLKYYCMKMLRYSMNEHFVCSVKAGQFYMGKEIMKRGGYHFIPNAIEVGKFVFDPAVRNRIRRNFQLEGKEVIGHVGRFSLQKNHKFLLELFAIIHKQRPQTRLVLIGDGEWHERVMRQINSLGIRDAVITPGSVSNPNEWYQAFDLFVLPSLWEGLPVVGVEAQTAGLPCIFSTAVTNEVALTGNAYFLPLDVSKDIWVRKINECFNSKVPRQDMTQTIINAHYDIATEALSLEKLYLLYAEKIGLR